MGWGGGIGAGGTIHVRDPKPLGCIHYVYHRGKGRRGGVSGGLKSFCREKRSGTEKCLKTGRGIANFFRCHWKITYQQESSWYL